jgi:hypothetical protein
MQARNHLDELREISADRLNRFRRPANTSQTCGLSNGRELRRPPIHEVTERFAVPIQKSCMSRHFNTFHSSPRESGSGAATLL